jgi:hypothetical protein
MISSEGEGREAPPAYERPEPRPASAEERTEDEGDGNLAPDRPRRTGWWQRR